MSIAVEGGERRHRFSEKKEIFMSDTSYEAFIDSQQQ